MTRATRLLYSGEMSSAPANLEHNELGIGAMTNVAAISSPPNCTHHIVGISSSWQSAAIFDQTLLLTDEEGQPVGP